MPTYDLTCRACGERFELFRTRMLRDEDKVCPTCGSVDVQPGIGGGMLGKGCAAARSANDASELPCNGSFS